MSGLCRVLRNAGEIGEAQDAARRLGLCPATDPRKYWDNVLAIRALEQVGVRERVLDVGCRSGILLTWLTQLGYGRLYGCDVKLPLPPLRAAVRRRQLATVAHGVRTIAIHGRRLRVARAERTGLPSASVLAVTAMSVIEHDVDRPAFFAEAARVLEPCGLLFISTDYWPTATAAPPGGVVFTRESTLDLVTRAEQNGFALVEEPELDACEPVVREDGCAYTFLTLAFTRRRGVAGNA